MVELQHQSAEALEGVANLIFEARVGVLAEGFLELSLPELHGEQRPPEVVDGLGEVLVARAEAAAFGVARTLSRPLEFAELMGVRRALTVLTDLQERCGGAYAPAPLLRTAAEAGTSLPEARS